MIRDSLALLAYEIKRRPEVAAMAENLDQLSDAAIRASDLPLPWMHEAMIRLKAKRQFDQLAKSADSWAVEQHTADPIGVVRRWDGAEGFLRIKPSGPFTASEVLMKPGQLVWLDPHGMWIDTIHTTHLDPQLKSRTVFQGQMLRSAYIEAVRTRRAGLVPSASVDPMQSVRIFRPA